MVETPTVEQIRRARGRLGDLVATTPVWPWRSAQLAELIGESTAVTLKLELFQYTGSFKPRGALTVMLDLDRPTLERGVTAVSAGNHAIAVAYAAQLLDTTAKVVMPKQRQSVSCCALSRLRRRGRAAWTMCRRPFNACSRSRQKKAVWRFIPSRAR